MFVSLLRRLKRAIAPQAALPTGMRVDASSDFKGHATIRKSGGRITIGGDCLVEGSLVTETGEAHISVGNNTFVGGQTLIDCIRAVSIGDDVLISFGCLITDSDNHNILYETRKNDLRDWRRDQSHDWNATPTAPVRIEKGAWLGARSIILKGVTVGEGAVVGAGSVVTKDVPPYTVVAGNPARVVKEIPRGD